MGFLSNIFIRKPKDFSFSSEESLLMLIYRSERHIRGNNFSENEFIDSVAESFPQWDKETIKEKIRLSARHLSDPEIIRACYISAMDLPVKRKIPALLKRCALTLYEVNGADMDTLQKHLDTICIPAFKPSQAGKYGVAFKDIRNQILDMLTAELVEHSPELVYFEAAKKYLCLEKDPKENNKIKFMQRVNEAGKLEGVGLIAKHFDFVPVRNIMVDLWGVPVDKIWSLAEENSGKCGE